MGGHVAERALNQLDVAALEADVAQRLDWSRATARPRRRALRDDPAAVGSRRPDDRGLLGDGRPRRARGAAPSTRIRVAGHASASEFSDLPLTLYSDPAMRGRESTPFVTAGTSSRLSSVVRQRPSPQPHRLDPRRKAERAAPDPALGVGDRTAGDAVRRQPRDGRPRRNGVARRHRGHDRTRSAADLPVVHPRSRSADTAADRTDPRWRVPRRARRGHRCGRRTSGSTRARSECFGASPPRAAPTTRLRESSATTSRARRCQRYASPTSTCPLSAKRRSFSRGQSGVSMRKPTFICTWKCATSPSSI